MITVIALILALAVLVLSMALLRATSKPTSPDPVTIVATLYPEKEDV